MVNLVLGKTFNRILIKIIMKIIKTKFGVDVNFSTDTTKVSVVERGEETEFELRVCGRMKNTDVEKLAGKLF